MATGYYKDSVRDGWFSETEALWPGQKLSIEIATKEDGKTPDILFEGRSDFQDILVFNSKTYGRVLVLDGVIQLSERDEFAYQEMIVHIPMFAHKAPKRVLIVGGGDGGVLREVVKHASVTSIDMCEIDPEVVRVSKEYFPTTMATAFGDPRLNLVHDDAAKFIQQEGLEPYDVIIVDSSDPVGPADVLFAPAFYEGLRKVLNEADGGVVCTQGECAWLHLDLIENVLTSCLGFFPTAEYAYTTVPTYPSGQIGFMVLSTEGGRDVGRLPRRRPPPDMAQGLRYYSAEVHRAAFVLPQFAERAVARARSRAGRPPRTPEDVPPPGGGGGCALS